MSFSFAPDYQLFLSLCLGTLGLLHAAGLVIPRLGRRMYDGFWPPLFADPAQRRAAWLRAGSGALGWLSFGLHSGLRQVVPLVCGGQYALDKLALLALGAIPFCYAGALFAQTHWQLTSQPTERKPLHPLVKRLATALLLVMMISGCFIVSATIRQITQFSDSLISLESIAMTSATEGWAVGDANFRGVVYRLAGGSWTKVDVGNIGMLTDLDLVSASEGWAVADSATLLHLRNGAWSPVAGPVGELRDVDMLSADEGWAVGNRGAIIHYQNGTWTQVASPTQASLEGVSMVSANEGWAVGGGDYAQGTTSVLLRYANGSWTLAPNPTTLPLAKIQMLSSDEGWAVGGNQSAPVASVVLRFQNGAWTPVASPAAIPLNDLRMISADEGWAVGGGLFRTPLDCPGARHTETLNTLLHYAQGTWQPVATPTADEIHGLAIDPTGTVWAVGGNAILRSETGRWREQGRVSAK